MAGAFCPRLILGLLTIQAAVHFLKVQAALKTMPCLRREYQAGEIISTKPGTGNQKNYCGSDTGWFYAVDNDLLFHLQCTSSASTPTLAKVTLINMKNRSNRENTFDPRDMCDIDTLDYGRQRPTVKNAYLIAKKLEGHWVPYHLSDCNGRHYVHYLADGQVTYSMTPNCPLKTTFQARTNVKVPDFKLSSQEGRYDWPQSQGRSRSPRRGGNDSGAVLKLSPSSKGKSLLPNPMQVFGSRSSSSRHLAMSSSEKYRKTPKSRKHRQHHNKDHSAPAPDESASTRSARPFWRLFVSRRK